MTVSDSTAAVSAHADQLTPTPAQIEGPYFRLGAPRRESLIEPGLAARS